MPSTSFSDLPTELIIQIFSSVDGLSTAVTLSSVSQRLLSIWKQLLPSFCETLLSRAIDCFDQAKDLVEAQSPVADSNKPSDATEAAIERAKLLFQNADIACLAYRSYEHCLTHREILNGQDITAAERTNFVKAWYRAITIATIGSDFEPLPYPFLITMDLLQFLQMMEVTSWLFWHQDQHTDKKLRPYMALLRGQRNNLFSLQIHLCRGPFNKQICQIYPTHFHTYILHDHSPANIYSGMEVGLGQLFSQIPTDVVEDLAGFQRGQ